MNNAIFGKVKENLRNRINVKLVNNKKCYLKCTLKPRYIQHKIFDNNLAAIGKSKISLKPNKPAYIRICVSQLSQVSMYKFHSGYIEKKYGNNARLLFSDTDSLMYETKAEDAYQKFSNDKKMFDFSK